MANNTISIYTFVIGTDYHDTIHEIEARTKADALKIARSRRVFPTDHIKYWGKRPLLKYVRGSGWVLV